MKVTIISLSGVAFLCSAALLVVSIINIVKSERCKTRQFIKNPIPKK